MFKKPIYLLHPYLTKFPFYRTWHEFKYHNHFHWAVFLLYSFSILSLLFSFLFPREVKAAYTVRPDHPRIYITKERLPIFRERAKPTGTHAQEYNNIITNADKYMNDTTTSISSLFYGEYGGVALGYAFLYKLGEIEGFNYTGHSTPAEYGQKAKQLLLQYAQTADADSIKMAIAYDWLYELLNESEKTTVVNAIIAKTSFAWRTDFFSESRGGEAPIAGLAFYGDGINDTKAKEFLDFFITKWVSGRILAENMMAGKEGGASSQAWGYPSGAAKINAKVFDAWLTATGENYFEKSTFVKGISNWITYLTYPRIVDKKTRPVKFADDLLEDQNTGEWWTYHPLFSIIASRYSELGDNTIASLAQFLLEKRTPVGWANFQSSPWSIIWWNKNIPAKSPDELNLPLTKYFDGMGTVVMRSGWDVSETSPDTEAHFIAQPYFYFGHDHFHQNSFVISKKGWLALDSGTRDMADGTLHEGNYNYRAIAHNTVIVYNPDEVFKFPEISTKTTNDGGQRILRGYGPNYPDVYPGSIYDVGGVKEFESLEGQYDYTLGDATRAYNSPDVTESYGTTNAPKISLFTRQFVYLRPQAAGGNEFFVVFDRVNSTNANFPKRWLLHSAYEPKLNGTEQPVTCGSHAEGHSQSTNSDLVTITNTAGTNSGRLFSKTLLPELGKFKINKIGGQGYATTPKPGNNQGNASLAGVEPNTNSLITEKWTITFINSTDFNASTDVRGNAGTGSTTTNWSSSGYLYKVKIPTTAWSGTPAAGDTFTFETKTGHQFEDAQCNNWPTYRTWQEWHGAWRVEVEPTVVQTDDLFLHVLQPTDASVNQMAPSSRIDSTDGNMTGALVDNRLVLFGKSGKYPGQVKYNLKGTGAVKNLLVDLTPFIKYTLEDKDLTTNQTTTRAITASDQGTLYFEITLASEHQITLTPGNQPIITLTKSVDQTQAYPGNILTYTITYKNVGNKEAKEAIIEDKIPSQTTYLLGSATNNGNYDSTNNKIIWNIGNLQPGQSGSLSFKVKVE